LSFPYPSPLFFFLILRWFESLRHSFARLCCPRRFDESGPFTADWFAPFPGLRSRFERVEFSYIALTCASARPRTFTRTVPEWYPPFCASARGWRGRFYRFYPRSVIRSAEVGSVHQSLPGLVGLVGVVFFPEYLRLHRNWTSSVGFFLFGWCREDSAGVWPLMPCPSFYVSVASSPLSPSPLPPTERFGCLLFSPFFDRNLASCFLEAPYCLTPSVPPLCVPLSPFSKCGF